MARIRTIKPEFWADEKLAPMDPTTRLVFIGLISMADDAGRLLDSLKQIDAMLFPLTDDSARESLAILSRAGRIQRGKTASGQPVIQIVNWRHQRVDHPNLAAALPAIVQPLTEDSRTIPEKFANDSREIPESICTNDLRSSTNDQRSTTGELQRAPEVNAMCDVAPLVGASLRGALGDHWPDVERFLASRRSQTHDAWMREMLKIIGPGSQFSAPDLAGACCDALALEDPLSGPHALRAFVAKKADERRSSAPPGAPVLTVVDSRDEAQRAVSAIRRLVQSNGVTRFVPRSEVEKMGPRILRAYDAIGGSVRFLATDADSLKWLPNEFARALAAEAPAGAA